LVSRLFDSIIFRRINSFEGSISILNTEGGFVIWKGGGVEGNSIKRKNFERKFSKDFQFLIKSFY